MRRTPARAPGHWTTQLATRKTAFSLVKGLHSPGYPAHHFQPEMLAQSTQALLIVSSASLFLNYGLRQAKLIDQG